MVLGKEGMSVCRTPENISNENKFQIKDNFLEKETEAKLLTKMQNSFKIWFLTGISPVKCIHGPFLQ